MAPRTAKILEDKSDAIDEALEGDNQRVATGLAEALDELSTFTDNGTSLKCYKVPKGSGKYEYCFDITPPVNTAELMEELKDKYGPGDYAIRVYVAGKAGCKAQKNFSIAATRDFGKAVSHDGFSMKDMLPLIMGQAASSKSDLMAMMQMQMQMQQASQQAQQAASQQSTQMMLGLVTAMMGAREKPGELIAAFAPLMAPKSNGFGEMVEIMKAVKELSGGGGGDGNDDIMTTVIKSIGPALPQLAGAAADGISAMRDRQRHAPVEHLREAPPHYPGTHQPILAPPAETPPQVGKYPLLAAIREDVLFYFQRAADPEFAAEGVVAVMDKAGFTEDDLQPIIIAFSTSPNWLDDLASEGIDLRANPVWAQSFLNAVIAEYIGEGDDKQRSHGGATDNGDHGATSADGKPDTADPQ